MENTGRLVGMSPSDPPRRSVQRPTPTTSDPVHSWTPDDGNVETSVWPAARRILELIGFIFGSAGAVGVLKTRRWCVTYARQEWRVAADGPTSPSPTRDAKRPRMKGNRLRRGPKHRIDRPAHGCQTADSSRAFRMGKERDPAGGLFAAPPAGVLFRQRGAPGRDKISAAEFNRMGDRRRTCRVRPQGVDVMPELRRLSGRVHGDPQNVGPFGRSIGTPPGVVHRD
jgi:hypothetical protein